MFDTILLIFGAIQGFLIGVTLFTQKQNKSSNFYLGLFVITLASQLVMALAGISQGQTLYLLGEVSFESFFLLGPLLYGYVRELTQKRFVLSTRLILHFLPFVFFLFLRTLLYSTQLPFLAAMFEAGIWQALVCGALQLISISAYVYASFQVINNYHIKIRATFTDTYKIKLVWLFWVLGAFQFIQTLLIIDTKLILLNYHAFGFLHHSVVIFIMLSGLSYWMAYRAHIQPNMFRLMLAEESTPVQLREQHKTALKSELTKEEAEQLKARILVLMEEDKPYLDSKIDEAKLAEKLEIASEVLVELIRQQFFSPFQDFMNQYRVEYAKRLLSNPEKNHVPVTNIGFSAGFNSLKNFQKVFEKTVKSLPDEFRESSQQN